MADTRSLLRPSLCEPAIRCLSLHGFHRTIDPPHPLASGSSGGYCLYRGTGTSMRIARFLLPRIEYILLIAIFFGVAASGPRILNLDGDLPRHLLAGQLILRTHRVLTTDVFSFRTVGYPSVPHEWGSQALFAAAYQWLGLSGVVLVTALSITLAWGLVFRRAMNKSRALAPSLVATVLGVAATQLHVLPRPHVFTYVFLALWTSLLERVGTGRGAWWLLPLLMLLWVNIHGMFILGVALCATYLLGHVLDHPPGERLGGAGTRALAVGAAASLAATVLSPSGVQIWKTIISLGSNSYITSRVPEYQSPNFHVPETWPFVTMLLLTVVGWGRAAQRIAWGDVLLIVTFASLALYTSRMISVFAIVATPLMAQSLASWGREDFAAGRMASFESNLRRINCSAGGMIWLFAVVIAVTISFSLGKAIDPARRGNVFDDRFFPVDAVSWLEIHPQATPVFNEFDWGGYLLLRLWPRLRVFMDGHTHIYGEHLTREYEKVISLTPGWEEIFTKYGIGCVIVRADAPLVAALSTTSAWKISYQDGTAVILTRKQPTAP